MSVEQARLQLRMLLVNARDHALADLSASKLATMYRVPVKECAAMLAAEREKRANPTSFV